MTEKEIIDIFKKTGAMLEGHFNLSSGLHSGQYMQCAKALAHPEYAGGLCAGLAEKFKDKKPTVIIAPALGGVIVSYEVARALKARSLFTERVDGKMALRRGFELREKDTCLVVEDVITTGLSTREVVDIVKACGAKVAGVGCLVDRSGGKVSFDAPFKSLLKVNIPTFKPADCPLCKEKLPLTKPGSR